MKISQKNLRKQYRIICELMWKNPRIHYKEIAPLLDLAQPYASKRVKEALDLQHIVGPELRKMSFKGFKEYMYFVLCDSPESLYFKLCKDPRVVYITRMLGFCDIWVISREEIEIEGDIVVQGVRSDFYMSKPPDHSWEEALKIMCKKVETFDPDKYVPKNYIQTHWDETVEWDEKDELLFRYFKYNLRRALGPLLQEHLVSAERLYKWFGKLPQYCAITTHYFPEGLPHYDSYLFRFETDYEDFIIEIFSELPTTSTFFKVSDKLFAYILAPKSMMKDKDPQMTTSEVYLPCLLLDLEEKGIAKRIKHAEACYFWRRRS